MTKKINLGALYILAILICVSFLFSSCYTTRVATKAQPGSEFTTLTTHSFFWGLVNKPVMVHTPICDSLGVNGVAEVTVKNNYGYALITVVTLGIWCPMKVSWACSKPCPKRGEL